MAPLCVALLLLPADGLQARTRKGDKLFKLGSDAEAHKEYDKALEYYQQALSTDPKETIYELATRRARFESGQEHVKVGKKLLDSGDLEGTAAEWVGVNGGGAEKAEATGACEGDGELVGARGPGEEYRRG